MHKFQSDGKLLQLKGPDLSTVLSLLEILDLRRMFWTRKPLTLDTDFRDYRGKISPFSGDLSPVQSSPNRKPKAEGVQNPRVEGREQQILYYAITWVPLKHSWHSFYHQKRVLRHRQFIYHWSIKIKLNKLSVNKKSSTFNHGTVKHISKQHYCLHLQGV